MNHNLLLELLTKKLIGEQELSDAENNMLEKALRDPELEDLLGLDPTLQQLKASLIRRQEMNERQIDRKMADLRLKQRTQTVRNIKPYLAAASVLCILAGALLWHSQQKRHYTTGKNSISGIGLPATDRASLRLSNGSIVYLDSTKNGKIGVQGTVTITKSGGQLRYHSSENSSLSSIGDNELSVPRGGQFSLILPDGSQVWLNSASEVSYPVSFGSERRIKLSGEAFISVTKDPTKPFYVETPHGTIEVLGTSFNVNAYADDHIQMTTLVEGSIRVSNGSKTLLLQPGEQAFENAEIMSVKHPSILNVTAWRRGFFALEDADIQTVMNQICRFYDVRVEFRNKSALSAQTYYGTIPRNQTLQETLKALELLKIKTTLSNRTIIVEPE